MKRSYKKTNETHPAYRSQTFTKVTKTTKELAGFR